MQQNDSDRTGHRQQKNNIQIGNVQNGKNTIYNIDNHVCMYRSDMCKFEMEIKNTNENKFKKMICMCGE